MKTILIIPLFLSWNFSLAQTFVEVPDINIEGVGHSWVEFADVDGDDDLDLLIQGEASYSKYTKLFENDGSGNFTEIENSMFEAVFIGCLSFADVDGDDDLDVLVSGYSGWPDEMKSTRLYFNDGTGVFTESGNSPFVNVSHGEIAFADVDGDSDQDVLITGTNGSSFYTKLYENDGSGNFSERTDTPFVGVARGSIAFADVDGDFDQDVLITGDTKANSVISRLYLNDGSGNFIEQTNSPFIGVTSGSVAFADIDGDSDQDVLITGGSSVFLQGEGSVLYTNDGMGNYTINNDTTFEGVKNSHVEFADIDGDSDQDVLITGEGEQIFSGLYINDGVGNFSYSTDNQIYPVKYGCAAFADVDNDSDLDLFLTGFNPGPPFPDWYKAILYINESQPVLNSSNLEDPLSGIIVYPNPFKSSDPINIGYDNNLTGALEFSILDGAGRLILHGNNLLEPGNDNIQISLNSLERGLYYLIVQHRQGEEVFPLIVD